MTRKIKINGKTCEVSKNEAKEAARILLFPQNERLYEFERFLQGSPTQEAKFRRFAIGEALGMKIDHWVGYDEYLKQKT